MPRHYTRPILRLMLFTSGSNSPSPRSSTHFFGTREEIIRFRLIFAYSIFLLLLLSPIISCLQFHTIFRWRSFLPLLVLLLEIHLSRHTMLFCRNYVVMKKEKNCDVVRRSWKISENKSLKSPSILCSERKKTIATGFRLLETRKQTQERKKMTAVEREKNKFGTSQISLF